MLANDLAGTMITDHRAILAELLASACEELFEGYGLKVQFAELHTGEVSVDAENNYIGILSASAEGFTTTMAIQTNTLILEKTYPVMLEHTDEECLRDWIGELSNQLVGRFKNKLIPYGSNITLGIPAVIQGAKLKAHLPKRTAITSHRFTTETGSDLFIYFSTLIESPPFQMHYPDTESTDIPMAEGDLIFF